MADFSFSEFEAAVRRCEDLRRAGSFREALAHYRDLLQRRLTQLAAAPDGEWHWLAADMVVIEQTADLSVLCGHPEAADNLLEAAAGLAAEAGNHYAAVYSTLKRIHLALERGLLRRAHSMLESLGGSIGAVDEIEFTPEGLDRWEASCSWPGVRAPDREVLFSRLYLSMARILSGLGQYGAALALYERGLRHAGRGTPPLAQVAAPHLRMGRAAALLELGEFDEAEAALGELEGAVEGLPGMATWRLELAGKLDLLRGRFGGALRRFEEVQATCLRLGFDRAAVAAALNLAHIYIHLNQTYRARLLLNEVAATAEVLGERASAHRARCLLDLAKARSQSLTDAVPVAPSVFQSWNGRSSPETDPHAASAPELGGLLDEAEESNYLKWFEDHALYFYWQLGRLDLPAAEAAADTIRQTFGSTDSAVVRARLELTEGVLNYYRGEYAQAADHLDRAVRHFEALGMRPELWQAWRLLGWCWERSDRAREDREALALRTGELLNVLASTLEGPEQAMYLLNKWTAEEEALAAEIYELTEIRKEADSAFWLRRPFSRRRLRRRVRDLLGKIDRYKGAAAAGAPGARASDGRGPREGILRRLFGGRDGRVTISFLVLPDRLFIARRAGGELDFGVSRVTRLDLRNLVRQWHESSHALVSALADLAEEEHAAAVDPSHRPEAEGDASPARRITEAKESREEASERLAAALQLGDLLAGLPASTTALTIAPDDCLHGLPFAALRHEGRYLVERYALALAFESEPPPRPPATPVGSALAVAVSKGFDEGYVPLPETVSEVDMVSGWLGEKGVSVRRLADDVPAGEPPTKQAVLAGLAGAEVFHIACHGRFEPNALGGTGLLLSAGADGQFDLLSLSEVLSLDLCRLRHATLTACWSADNYILPGRWIISLPEVIWRAGAESVLGNLWPAEDRVAAALVERFYRRLDEHPRDEALRRAQLDCLHGDLLPPEEFGGAISPSDPVFWAGYRLFGQPGRLHFARSRPASDEGAGRDASP